MYVMALTGSAISGLNHSRKIPNLEVWNSYAAVSGSQQPARSLLNGPEASKSP